MKRGRPEVPKLKPLGGVAIPTWLTADQKKEARKIVKAGGSSWGELQTDLVAALAVARCNLKIAIRDVDKNGEYTTSETGVPHVNPYAKTRDVAISQICSISTKLGLSVNGTAGKVAEKADIGPSAADFLTLTPRSKAK